MLHGSVGDSKMADTTGTQPPRPSCSLLLFVATPAEEKGLELAAKKLKVKFEEDSRSMDWFRDKGVGDETAWDLGTIGTETVIAIGPTREEDRKGRKGRKGTLVMGAHGRLGSAAKTMRYLAATGAQGVVQVGMAFGVSPHEQKLGDVLVSALLSPYDNRTVKRRDEPPGYVYDYEGVKVEKPRSALLDRFRIEKERREKAGESEFKIHIGAMLSGSARIHCAAYRDELLRIAPSEGEEFVGGEMEGVGLLSGSMKAGDPVWCVVKGISDFADENRDNDIRTGREKASYHAALFVLSSLMNDVKGMAERGET